MLCEHDRASFVNADEQFEAGGEELRRHFSMDGGMDPEKLRAAPSAEVQRQAVEPLFTGNSDLGDDVMSQAGEHIRQLQGNCV